MFRFEVCHISNSSFSRSLLKTEVMKPNMGKMDRLVRLSLGAIGLLMVIFGSLSGAWNLVVLILSVVFVLTSSISFCPLYTMLGLRTNK